MICSFSFNIYINFNHNFNEKKLIPLCGFDRYLYQEIFIIILVKKKVVFYYAVVLLSTSIFKRSHLILRLYCDHLPIKYQPASVQ